MKEYAPVVVMHNVPPEDGALESQKEVLKTVDAVCDVLGSLNIDYRVAGIHTLHDVTLAMRAGSAPVVFNLVEELLDGAEHYNLIPAVCEAFGKQVTGSDTAALLLTQDKWQTKCLLKGVEIGVPAGMIYEPGGSVEAPGFSGPYFVKPVATDASEGIETGCVFNKFSKGMVVRIESLHERFHQAVLVEQFVGTREFNVSVLEEDDGAKALPVAEIEFRGIEDPLKKIVDYAAKWSEGSPQDAATVRKVPANVSDELGAKLQKTALSAFHMTGCREYARVDMRMDDKGIYVLEVNANPAIAPGTGFVAALNASGRTFNSFVESLIDRATKRLQWQFQPGERCAVDKASDLTVRRTWKKDIPTILRFLRETGFFREDEIQTAREVLVDALGGGEAGHYQSWTCCEGSRPVGWICCGATPCTVGTFDIYWIGVDPQLQRRGVGRLLVKKAEEFIRQHDGRQLVIETSGRPAYESTRGFYHHLGFTIQARLPDFYAVEDDKIIYMKAL